MPATPDEMARLVEAYDKAHRPITRAMADLLIRGNVILEEHGLLEGQVGEDLEALVFKVLTEHGVSKEEFAAVLIAFEQLRDTIDHLDQLPP